MEERLSKKAISDIALVSKHVRIVGGSYIVHQGCQTQYQDNRKGIIIESNLDSLDNDKNNDFRCTKTTDKELDEDMKSLTKGKSLVKEKGFGINFTRNSDSSYLFSNGHRKVAVDHERVTLRMPTIQQFTETAQQVGVNVLIKNIGELSLTGKEDNATLVIRDKTFSSILTNSGEHFFKKNSGEYFLEFPPLFLESKHFLQIGRENFQVGIYKNKGGFWLLTAVTPGTGIQCRILEELSIL